MIRLAIIFFASDTTVYSVCNVAASSNAQGDIDAAVAAQWPQSSAGAFAFWGNGAGESCTYNSQPAMPAQPAPPG